MIKKAPRPPEIDYAIQNKLNKVKNSNKNFNKNNGDDNNGGLSPPQTAPIFNNFQPPPPPLLLPTFNNFISAPPSQPPPTFNNFPPLPSLFNNFTLTEPKPSLFGSQTITMTTPPKEKIKEEKVIDDIDMAIYKLPDPPKIEIGDPLLNVLTTEAEGILEDDCVNDKVIQEKTIEQIKDEYKFDDIRDAIDEGKIPPQLEFFLVVIMTILSMLAIFCLSMKTITNSYHFYVQTRSKTK